MQFRNNNIGVLPSEPLSSQHFSRKTLTIVKYHPNPYFGMLDTYLADGWLPEGDHISFKGVRLEKELFSKEESHYVLAFVHSEKGEDYTRLESVEDRPAFLEPTEYADFFKAYQKANHSLISEDW